MNAIGRQDVARTILQCIETLSPGIVFDIEGQKDRYFDLQQTCRSIIRDGGSDEMFRFICSHLAELMIATNLK